MELFSGQRTLRHFCAICQRSRSADIHSSFSTQSMDTRAFLETSVADAQRAVHNVHKLSEAYGQRSTVWRYDTIIFTSETPRDFHVENFGRIASQLRGTIDEVVISFSHFYQKTKRNVDKAADEGGFSWWDPPTEEKRNLVQELLGIARSENMKLSVCSQRDYLVEGAIDAKCVDAKRIEDVARYSIRARIKGNRKECGCFESRDIGDYNTCPHGCVYCYAVQSREIALSRYKRHDPSSEFLFVPTDVAPSVGGQPPKDKSQSGPRQISLFGGDAVDESSSNQDE